MSRPRTLPAARAVSDALLDRSSIQGLEVTELRGHEAQLQWRLAVALQSGPAEQPFAPTAPAELLA